MQQKNGQLVARRRSPVSTLAALTLIAVGAVFAVSPSFAAGDATSSTGRIDITQDAAAAGGLGCAPKPLTYTAESTAEIFRLVVIATARPCAPIHATAAIYAMPGGGVAWPQRLFDTEDFTITEAGTTTITFTKTCAPEQFDVVTGDTPDQISPTGPFSGPLLIPDLHTALQHWGSNGCTPSSTTTAPTTSIAADTTTTTVGGATTTTVDTTTTTAQNGVTTTTSGSGVLSETTIRSTTTLGSSGSGSGSTDTGSGSGVGSSLAVTGSSISLVLLAGLGQMLVGGVILAKNRRSRH